MLVACVAPGPSLTRETCDRLAGRCRVLVVNNAYQLAPWADWLYACDRNWWDVHEADVRAHFYGECWTQAADAAEMYRLHHVQMAPPPERFRGLDTRIGNIRGGYNGGYQAINLALHFGATRILLVGYDMQPIGDKHHFFGEYTHPKLAKSRDYARFAQAFDTIRPEDYGLEIVNCTPGSAVRAFPFMELSAALDAYTEG